MKLISRQEDNDAKKELERIDKKEEKQQAVFGKKKKKIWSKYYEAERKLTEQKYKETDNLENQRKKFQESISKESEPFCKISITYKRILDLMSVNIKPKTKLDFKVYEYIRYENKKEYLKEIDTIVKDDFKNIKVFICNNGKPKNKYTLCVLGNTIFTKGNLIKLPYAYGIDCHTETCNIKSPIRDAPTRAALVSYYTKQKTKILKDFLEEHKKLEEEFTEVIEKTSNSKSWEINYWEYQEEYYSNYSDYENNEDYKNALKQLRKLRKLKEKKNDKIFNRN